MTLNGPDKIKKPNPFYGRGNKKGIKRPRFTALLYAKLIELLYHDSYTIQELAEELGFHYVSIQRYVSALRLKNVAYIESWVEIPSRTRLVASYRLGTEKDKKYPALSRNERSYRYRVRKKEREAKASLQTSLFSFPQTRNHLERTNSDET